MTVQELDAFKEYLKKDMVLSGKESLISEETLEKCAKFYEFLVEENKKYNLTSIIDPEKAAYLHFVDSLAAEECFPKHARVLDVGCGAGFPTIPLAIFRPDLNIIGCDATEKKVHFVKEAARICALPNVGAICGRAEELARKDLYREKFDVVTARAVAALPILSELCLPLLKTDGLFVALKGQKAEEEREASMKAFETLGGTFMESVELKVVSERETVIRFAELIKKTAETPDEYPRVYGRILKKPL